MLDMNLSMAVPFVACLAYCALIVLVLYSPRTRVAKVFLGYLVLMLIWSLSSLMMRTGIFPGPLAWNRLMLFGTIGVPFVFFHFSMEMIGNIKGGPLFLLRMGYFLVFVLAVSNLLGLIVNDAYLSGGVFVYTLGPVAQVFAMVAGVYMLSAAILLTREGFKNPVSFWSNLLVYPSVGSVLMLAGSVLNLFPGVGKYPIDITANTINAMLLTYAIYRYRLLNITIHIRKGLVYSVLTVLLTGSYLLSVYLVQQVVVTRLGYSTVLVALPMAALISLLFDPLKNSLRVWIDKAIFREQYSYRQTLKEFSRIMTSILDLDRLAQSILDLLTKALQSSSGALFLPDPDGNFLVLASVNTNQDLAAAVRIDKTNPMVRWLSQHQEAILDWEEIETVPDFQGLWHREKEDLQEMDASVLVGIKMQNQLIGILLLSKKTSGDPYTADDRELLTTLANEAAVAINNAKIYNEAKSQAVKDELTKLYNYRFMHEFLDKEIARSKRTKQNFSVIFLDLDLFKAYNDIFGHLAGDEALIRVGMAIMDTIRTADVAARIGGDEFAIVLPGADAHEALAVAERVREAVQQFFPGASMGSGLLTVSLGVAFYPEHGRSKQQLLFCADQALLQAKHAGRNMVSVYKELENAGHAEITSIGGDSLAERDFLTKQVEEAYLSTIYTLAAAINARDNYTYKHSEMVTMYAVSLAEALGLSEEHKKQVRHAAMLHDIGKIGTPEYILNKPGNLTEDERDVIQRHVVIAEAIINQTPYLRSLAPIILHHHEAYDGTGYPSSLKGEEIPMEARILAIADAYHAMTSDRPYRRAMSKEEAIQKLLQLADIQFDPGMVPVFVRMLRKNLAEKVVQIGY